MWYSGGPKEWTVGSWAWQGDSWASRKQEPPLLQTSLSFLNFILLYFYHFAFPDHSSMNKPRAGLLLASQ